tara:strand:+ start:169 stop:759 length:591 start_codon:yes stop_codon:yes gene_type:complete
MIFGRKDFIKIYDNTLSSSKCCKIIEFINSQNLCRGKLRNGVIDLYRKNIWEVDNNSSLSNETEVDQYLVEPLVENIILYRNEYPGIDGISLWDLGNYYNLQKCEPGQGYYEEHCGDDAPEYDRVLEWTLYLNTVTDKGGTYYTDYNKTIKAKEGRLVLCPPYWTHRHRGIVSNTQTAYTATGWFFYKNNSIVKGS